MDPRCRESGLLGVASTAVQAGKSDPLVRLIVRGVEARDLAGGFLIPRWQLVRNGMNVLVGAGAEAFTAVSFAMSFVVGALGGLLVEGWGLLRYNILGLAVAGSDASTSAVLSVVVPVVAVFDRSVGVMRSWSWLHDAILASINELGNTILEAYRQAVARVLWFFFSWGSLCLLILCLWHYGQA